ncbi:MAG: DUF2142 domain-containing protein [Cytophagaceae bacterium]|nr:DUF2142 domain-containing protein [Cytophagaceae bacterium]
MGYILITPPFQVNDEVSHFYRAYQVSQGDWISIRQNQRVGGYLPASLQAASDPFLHLRWNVFHVSQPDTILSLSRIPTGEKMIFLDFPNTAIYPPLAYVPQAIGISIARLVNMPPLPTYYFTKVFCLFIWSWLVYGLLKTITFLQVEFAFLALLPMSIYVNGSISGDMMCTCFCWTFLVLLLNHWLAEVPIRETSLAAFLILSAGMALLKFIYLPLLLLIFLIPKRLFRSRLQAIVFYAGCPALALVSLIAWSVVVQDLYITYEDYHPDFVFQATVLEGANIQQQLQWVLHHPLEYTGIFIRSIGLSFERYSQSYIGTFGWLDTFLPIPWVLMAYLLIIGSALTAKVPSIGWRPRAWMLVTSFACLASLFLSQFLIWNIEGDQHIDNIHGRYLSPFLPLLWWALAGLIPIRSHALRNWMLFGFISSLGIFSILTIYQRFYDTNTYQSVWHLSTQNDELLDRKHFNSGVSQYPIEISGLLDSTETFHGNYSVKTDSMYRFAYTVRISEILSGDVLECYIWCKGDGAVLVVDEEGEKYHAINTVIRREKNGWNQMYLRYKFEKDLHNNITPLYIYNPSNEVVYLDNMEVWLKRVTKP